MVKACQLPALTRRPITFLQPLRAGDNRNDSIDSRYWGFVPRAAIAGRPLLVYLPAPQPNTSFFHRLTSTLHHIRILH